VLILSLVDKTDTYTQTIQQQYFRDVLSVQQAFVASLRFVQGLPDFIDPDKPPINYKDAMSRPDNQEWAKAYMDEYLGFKERQVFPTVPLPKGTKVLGTTTRLDYKVYNGVLTKRKVRMCVRGDQQTEVSFNPSDLYSSVLKAPEARLLAAIAAEHGCLLLKIDMWQAFL
jgi:hypothetical protein